jgi:hypothetical protein
MKFFLDNKRVQINAYLYSTDVLSTVVFDAVTPPSLTPQYAAGLSHVWTTNWTHSILV